MTNEKVLYVGRTTYGRIEKICKDKSEALAYHYEMIRQGLDLLSYATFPAEYAGVNIDRLSHVDVSDQLPN